MCLPIPSISEKIFIRSDLRNFTINNKNLVLKLTKLNIKICNDDNFSYSNVLKNTRNIAKEAINLLEISMKKPVNASVFMNELAAHFLANKTEKELPDWLEAIHKVEQCISKKCVMRKPNIGSAQPSSLMTLHNTNNHFIDSDDESNKTDYGFTSSINLPNIPKPRTNESIYINDNW